MCDAIEIGSKRADPTVSFGSNTTESGEEKAGASIGSLTTAFAGTFGEVSEILAPGSQVGRYVIRQYLGAGGMGVVYAAVDPALDREVALKLLRRHLAASPAGARMEDRLLREAQSMARLAHPNVVAVHDAGRIRDQVFIAMELVPGDTLRVWLDDQARGVREILANYCQAGRGLAAAHAAGILHRDFKPENVLVGRDRRVRVTDFGLARSLSPGEEVAGEVAAVVPLEMRLTLSGARVGTPRYMAPEQFAGEPADTRSDQFSFCVALWESLYDDLPFAGKTVDELAQSVLAGTLREPPRGAPVPGRVRRALARGLARAAGDRHPSMEALLAELEPAERRPLRAWLAAAVAAALIAGAVAVSFAGSDGRDQELCTGAAARFASAWNPARHAEIDRAFAATELPYAAGAARSVAWVLDRYRVRWVSMHAEACKATRVRGEQPEKVLELRMMCLEERLADVRALVEIQSAADRSVVETSVAAAYRLPDLGMCADVAALSAAVPPPREPAVAKRVPEMRGQLARVRALKDAGKLAEALSLARTVASGARALGYRPLEAEALLLLAQVEQRTGDRAAAEATFMRAIYAAEAGKHDVVAANAWTDLVFLVGYENAEYARGLELGKHATAAIERLGGNSQIEGLLEKGLGAIDGDQGRHDQAAGHFERAVELLEHALGPDHPSVATALDNLGMALLARGEGDRALELHRRSLAARERTLGAEHPAIASSLQNLGNDQLARGDYLEAEDLLRRAVAMFERTLGPDDQAVATALSDLGRALRGQGRFADALAVEQRGLALGERTFGPEHPTFAAQLVVTGVTLYKLGRLDEALAHHQRAAAIYARVMGPAHPQVAYTWLNIGDVRLKRGQPRAALANYRRALPILEKAHGPDHPRVVSALISIGQAELASRRPARAIEPLERARGALNASGAPSDRAAIDFLLARALWETGHDRRRARALATIARDDYASAGAGFAPHRAEVDRWLARAGLRRR